MAKRSKEKPPTRGLIKKLGDHLDAGVKAGDFDDHFISVHEGYAADMKASAEAHRAEAEKAAASGDHAAAAKHINAANDAHAESIKSAEKAAELRSKHGGGDGSDDRKRDDHGRFES